MTKSPSESQIQIAFHMWFEGVPNKIQPAKRPGVVAWHTPNGEARDGFAAARLKAMGVLAGIPDYLILWQGLFAIEFKAPKGRMSPAQLDLQPQLINAGLSAYLATDSLDAAKAFCRQHRLTQPNS
jgi:hypothetical protein